MNIDSKYVISGLKKSLSSNLKTMIFFIPFIILISTFVFSLILPTYNHYVFVKNGNHNYVYSLKDEQYKKTGKEIEAVYYDRNITSHPDPTLDQSGYNIYYKYSSMVNLYICRNNIDVNKTMFSNNNMFKTVRYTEPNIWLSYELAKTLHVGIGDSVYMRFTFSSDFKDMPIKVSGISRTKYSDTKPTKSTIVTGNAMIFMDDSVFDWVLNETDQSKIKILFSDTKIDEFNNYLLASKETQLLMTNTFVNQNIIKAIYVILSGIVLIYIVLSLDISFTLKRHNKNMIILNMLGVPMRSIRKIFIKLTMLNFTISTIIALILVKYIFIQELLSIYVDLLPLVICFIVCMMVGIISSIFQSFKIKKL